MFETVAFGDTSFYHKLVRRAAMKSGQLVPNPARSVAVIAVTKHQGASGCSRSRRQDRALEDPAAQRQQEDRGQQRGAGAPEVAITR